MATQTGIFKSVVITSTAVNIGTVPVTYALSITSGATPTLAVDLDTDDVGNIKSLQVFANQTNTVANALAPTSILELQFPNNPAVHALAVTAAVTVTLS
jgi:hypothetical protein